MPLPRPPPRGADLEPGVLDVPALGDRWLGPSGEKGLRARMFGAAGFVCRGVWSLYVAVGGFGASTGLQEVIEGSVCVSGYGACGARASREPCVHAGDAQRLCSGCLRVGRSTRVSAVCKGSPDEALQWGSRSPRARELGETGCWLAWGGADSLGRGCRGWLVLTGEKCVRGPARG